MYERSMTGTGQILRGGGLRELAVAHAELQRRWPNKLAERLSGDNATTITDVKPATAPITPYRQNNRQTLPIFPYRPFAVSNPGAIERREKEAKTGCLYVPASETSKVVNAGWAKRADEAAVAGPARPDPAFPGPAVLWRLEPRSWQSRRNWSVQRSARSPIIGTRYRDRGRAEEQRWVNPPPRRSFDCLRRAASALEPTSRRSWGPGQPLQMGSLNGLLKPHAAVAHSAAAA
jgi:hypothetical protein